MKPFNNKRLVTIAAGLLLIALPAASHTSGFTYEANVGNYFVDIGASRTELAANQLTLFEFNLYPTNDPNNLADFDNVYVTIGDDSAVQLATFVHRPPEMLTVLSYSFPKAGRYEVSARFMKGHADLAEVSFPIEVGEGQGVSGNLAKIVVLGVFGAAVVITGLVRLRRRASPPVDR
jgi:hypothetical protein